MVLHAHAEGVRRGYPALAVRGPREGHADLAARDFMDYLHHVAGRVDGGIRGPEFIVDHETARGPYRQSGRLREG